MINKLGALVFPAEGNEFVPTPVVDRVFGMTEARQAHEYMESNQSIGKILLRNDL